jgi:hypothetical protein
MLRLLSFNIWYMDWQCSSWLTRVVSTQVGRRTLLGQYDRCHEDGFVDVLPEIAAGLGFFSDSQSSLVSRFRIAETRCVKGRSFMDDLELGGHGVQPM